MPYIQPSKHIVAQYILSRGYLYLHLDPRKMNVVVPAWFKHQADLCLEIGTNMPIPIPDLVVDEVGIHATLSFARSPFVCFIPWTAVFALMDDVGRGQAYESDIPPEVKAQIQADDTTEITITPAYEPSRVTSRPVQPRSKAQTRAKALGWRVVK